jgi:hypothetical protein
MLSISLEESKFELGKKSLKQRKLTIKQFVQNQ